MRLSDASYEPCTLKDVLQQVPVSFGGKATLAAVASGTSECRPLATAWLQDSVLVHVLVQCGSWSPATSPAFFPH